MVGAIECNALGLFGPPSPLLSICGDADLVDVIVNAR